MLTVGLAGCVEVQGTQALAERLVLIAHRLSEQVKEAAQAVQEAAEATKN